MTDPHALTLVDAALRGTLLALLLLMATVLWRDRPRAPAARAGSALCLGLCVQTVSATPLFEALVPCVWQSPLVGVSVANAVLFWVFVQALFDDEFEFLPVHGAAWLAAATLAGVNCALRGDAESALASIPMGFQRAVPLLFAVLAVIAAAAHWRADLVEGRRRLRVFIVVTGVAYTLAMLAARLAAPQGRLSGTTAILDVAALLAILAVVAWQLLRLADTDLLPPFPARTPAPGVSGAPAAEAVRAEAVLPALTPPDPAEERLVAALQRVMAGEHAYRDEELSVASLAGRLAVPEYRLRRLINRRLGYRNFNAYVNGLRLHEARAALADPARRAVPVLTIALEAGFQSIGPFNRAFKAATGATPTEYRREKLADS